MKLPTIIREHWKLIMYWAAGSIVAIALLAWGVFFAAERILAPTAERSEQVVEFVRGFGETLDDVSLASSTEEIAASMDAQYGPYLSDELLASWKSDPALALGRQKDGSVPSGIRIKSVRNVGQLSYTVKAFVETRTPAVVPGLGSVNAIGERPYTFGIAWRAGGWEIVEYAEGHAAPIE